MEESYKYTCRCGQLHVAVYPGFKCICGKFFVKPLTAKKDAVAESPACNNGLSDPAILHNTVETLIYGLSNISTDEGGAALAVCNSTTMDKFREFISKILKGI